MNTETTESQPISQNLTPDPNGVIPPPPPSPIIPEQKSGINKSILRVAVIILALVALGLGISIYIASNANKQTPPSSPKTTLLPTPSIREKPTGLTVSVSDEPAIMEKDMNSISVDDLDKEESDINQELINL